jgi:ATP/maltotriose-dependent transcriptional regulator MalT/two-component SAPR family response regulator
LLKLLEHLLDQKLIVISAPAGYGKTSLLIDFSTQSLWPIAWFSLDSLDKDPYRFIAHLIAALQKIFPDFGKNASTFLNNTSQDKLDLNTLITVFVNDIFDRIKEHFILVLDDYHFVEESETINQIINQFLQDVDENCHLIVSSRRLLSLPDMPLLVARNQVGGISYEEISFSAEEIQSLVLQNYHISLTSKSAEEISKLTEGWITGLLLSTHILGNEIEHQLRISRVSGVGLYDYMAQQVFDQQPEPIKEFLLRTALLEEFDVNLCEKVLGNALNTHVPWQSLIDEVMKRNLFIQQVGEGEQFWLRYHHLFKEFLKNVMWKLRPDETRKILLSLADHYKDKGDWDVAFNQYSLLEASDKMVSLVEQVGSFMVTAGRFLTLQKWLSELPTEITHQSPIFISLRGAILVNSGKIYQGIALFSEVIDHNQNDNQFDEVFILTLTRRAVSYRMIGEYETSQKDSQRVLELIEGKPHLGKLRGEAYRNLGLTFYYRGDFKQALRVLKQSLDIYESYKDEVNVPRVLFNIALLHKVLGDYDLSEQMYEKTLAYWQSGSNFSWLADLLNNLGVLQQLRGEYSKAAKSFEKAIQYSRINNSPRTEAISLTSLGDLYRDLDGYDEAIQVYEDSREIAKQLNINYLLFYIDLAEAILSQSTNDIIKAKSLFERASEKARKSGSSYNVNLLTTELAMFWLKSGNADKAFEMGNQAQNFFQEEGHQIEAFRAKFTCALSLIVLGNYPKAVSDLRFIASIITGQKYVTPLLIQARLFSDVLESIRNRADIGKFSFKILEKVNQYENDLLALRKKVRQQASVVPFEPARLIIQTFGKAQVFVKNKLITSSDWQTATAKDMFFVFLAHPDGLTKEQVGLLFWPDSSNEEVKLRFKNSLYRLRRAIGSEAIILDEVYYYFNRALDYEYDVDIFTKSIEAANSVKDIEERIKYLLRAIKVYTGDYLPEVSETWVIVPRRRYHQMQLDALMQLSNIYMQKKAYKPALRYCFQALSEEPCLEEAHRLVMRIHAATGNRVGINRQYEHCCIALSEEINALPSKQTVELYEMLMHD